MTIRTQIENWLYAHGYCVQGQPRRPSRYARLNKPLWIRRGRGMLARLSFGWDQSGGARRLRRPAGSHRFYGVAGRLPVLWGYTLNLQISLLE